MLPGSPSQPLTQLADDDLGRLLRIRNFELALLELFDQGLLHGTTHTCLGQEYVPVSIQALIRDDDFIFSNHRGHGHYLARYDDCEGLLAEIMGRAGALCGGYGGSQHLYRANYLSTGVQGQSIPVAVGLALSFKDEGAGRIVCTYIGDGTWGEGAVYEALNISALWTVPLLVIVENNGIAQSTPVEQQMAGTIADRATAFGLQYLHIAIDDVNEIRYALAPVIAQIRRGGGPAIVEFATRRLGPHSKGDDSRSEQELQLVKASDWYVRYKNQFPGQLERVDRIQQHLVRLLVNDVSGRPLADGLHSES
jgi:pyruvate dehydrogenase E1 component alpha subunit